MSTFLELCNMVHERTGESGADLTTVIGQTGYRKRLVNYVKDAWKDIQSKHHTWRFMRKAALPTIAAAATSVDADAWVVANLSTSIDFIHKDTFSIYKTATGTSDETDLVYVEWEDWKRWFGLSYADGAQNRPVHITLDPDTSNLVFGPTSNDAYTISFEFQANPVIWSADADTLSGVAASMHEIVKWRALMRYAAAEEDASLLNEAKSEFRKYMRKLELRYGPSIKLPDPLA